MKKNTLMLLAASLAWGSSAFALGGVSPSMLKDSRLVSKEMNFSIETPKEGRWTWLTEAGGVNSRGQGFIVQGRGEFSVNALKYRVPSKDQAGAEQLLVDTGIFGKTLPELSWTEVEPGWAYAFSGAGLQGRVFITDRAAYLIHTLEPLRPELQPVFDAFVSSFQLVERPSLFGLGGQIAAGAILLLGLLFVIMRLFTS